MVKIGDMTIQDEAVVLPYGFAININRDLSAASNTVSYTGFGFAPNKCFAFCAAATTAHRTCIGIGVRDGGLSTGQITIGDNNGYSTDTWSAQGYFIVTDGGGNNYYAEIKNWSADGFDLVWTKVGSPTGTLNCRIMAFK